MNKCNLYIHTYIQYQYALGEEYDDDGEVQISFQCAHLGPRLAIVHLYLRLFSRVHSNPLYIHTYIR